MTISDMARNSTLGRALSYAVEISARLLVQAAGTLVAWIAPRREPLLVGGVQRVGAHEILGWAGRRDRWLSRSAIDVYDGDRLVGTVEAKPFRPDVPRSRKNLGFPTFVYDVPQAIKDGREHLLTFKHAATNQPLTDEPIKYWYAADGLTSPRPRLAVDPVVRQTAWTGAGMTFEDLCRGFERDGSLLLRGLIATELCDRIIEETDSWFQLATPDGRCSWYKCHDLWRDVPAVRELACDPDILRLVSHLHGRSAIPFQTLNLKYGSQQRAHSDAIHFSCFPRRFMCGAWVALEDVDARAGPLFVYPGSHKLPERDFCDIGVDAETDPYAKYEDHIEQLMAAERLERSPVLIKKGDVFIWSSNTVHGGSPIADLSLTRWSQVTHYFFEDCAYYVPMHSHAKAGEYFLKPVTNMLTGEPVPHRFNGRPLRVEPAADGRARLFLS